ncbi:MAG TPA: RAMP superfamily CRISPR-associated protein [Candidatus Brocadiaceae bacterium]|nr:RAMP superfamily CRISPR-associated protein [Candidatus Brocadiaceae bacterium]
MKSYTIQIQLISDALISSGEGFGSLIDTDFVFDGPGVPFIPARRIKGCLRDAAQEVCEMLGSAGINSFVGLRKEARSDGSQGFCLVEETFGRPGHVASAPVFFSNFTIEEYESNSLWLQYFCHKYPNVMSRDSILSTYGYTHQQTGINERGVADAHSLRTIRAVKKGTVFNGEVRIDKENINTEKLLALACAHLQCLGTKRNRGFGEVECRLLNGTADVSNTILNELEALCKN